MFERVGPVGMALAWISSWFTASMFSVSAPMGINLQATTPIVDLGYARYQGYFDAQTKVTNFLGIRYAAPPLGHLRFQAPQAPSFEPGIQPATQNPSMCYQIESHTSATTPASLYQYSKRYDTTPPVSEDCLFLNVFAPGTIPAEPVTTGGLPVLVWIHGGSYGHGYAAAYNGANLVSDSLNSVVVVVIQYRLGAFGFLSGDEVKTQGALNAGLLDQAFALQWVQDHIALFGGDKDHVTIWGESAGGGSVLQHIIAHGGNTQPPLFNAAIASSMCLLRQYNYNDPVPQFLYDKIVAMTGCTSSADTFMCLQSADAETLWAANNVLGAPIFVPVVDGTFILERPTVTLSKGRVNGQVLLTVTNQNEGSTFVDAHESLTITDYISQIFPEMTSLQVQEAAVIYQDYGTALEQAIMMTGDSIFVCPTYYLLEAFAGRSWKGLFAVPPAHHAQDVAYYFSSRRDPEPYDAHFVNAFVQPFMSVAKDYDVNAKFDPTNRTPYWHAYAWGETEMLFNRTEGGEPVVVPIHTDPAVHERCAFWSTVTSNTAQ